MLIFQVFYEIKGFLEKNRDTLRDDLLNTLKESRFPLLLFIFFCLLSYHISVIVVKYLMFTFSLSQKSLFFSDLISSTIYSNHLKRWGEMKVVRGQKGERKLQSALNLR